jgi:hypothetical protein
MTLCPCLHAGDLHSYSLGLLSSIIYTLNRQQILPENSKCSLLACTVLSCPVKLPTNPHLTNCHTAVAYCTHNNMPQAGCQRQNLTERHRCAPTGPLANLLQRGAKHGVNYRAMYKQPPTCLTPAHTWVFISRQGQHTAQVAPAHVREVLRQPT